MKDSHGENFEHVDKIMPCFFSKAIKKPIFSKSALFRCEMVGLSNFGRDIDVYIVNSNIFIKKIFYKLL